MVPAHQPFPVRWTFLTCHLFPLLPNSIAKSFLIFSLLHGPHYFRLTQSLAPFVPIRRVLIWYVNIRFKVFVGCYVALLFQDIMWISSLGNMTGNRIYRVLAVEDRSFRGEIWVFFNWVGIDFCHSKRTWNAGMIRCCASPTYMSHSVAKYSSDRPFRYLDLCRDPEHVAMASLFSL